MSKRWNRLGPWSLTVFGAAFVLFLYTPLVLILVYSFNANPVNMVVWTGFTTDWYGTLFGMRPGGASFDAALQ